jgi:type III restriction enzyme
MKISLFDFQEEALGDLRRKITVARLLAAPDNPQAISFSAATGSGKTIVMAALFEDIFFGEPGFEAQPDAVILWISDIPELNEQTRLKIEGKSDRIRVRQLVTIDSNFDAQRLDGGHIYFVNTQKLGTDKLLTQNGGDKRQYAVWETFTNTAMAIPDRFYVVIDEAHRGMRLGRAEERARTILQRFLLGSQDVGLCRMPMVIGVSATPRRFEDLLAGTTHTVYKVYVPADEVRKSGLIKDRILIHYPDVDTKAEMTLLAEASSRWQNIVASWAAYCERQQEATIWPILVVQVEDGTDKILTKSDLVMTISTIERVISRRLRDGEVAHNFNDTGDLDIGGHRVPHIEASRIQEDQNIAVVMFKMSLSTGWDCPRAEVMMSFRRAEDHTYIAQLLGRMVRTPLARRVELDAALNDVHLFLPHYDQAAVQSVIQDLRNVEDVPPSEAGTSRELVTLQRREGTEAIFDAIQGLITYRVNAVRKQSALRRLMGLGRALTQDGIDETAQNMVKDLIVENMNVEIQRLRDIGELDSRAKQVIGIDLRTIAVQHGTDIIENGGEYTIEAASVDIDQHFQEAGYALGNGLHMEYWKAHGDREANSVKVEVIILRKDPDAMINLEEFAEEKFDLLYEQHKVGIGHLKEQRRSQYEKLRLATSKPQNIPWYLPEIIGFTRSTKAPMFDRHLYVEDDDSFHADLGTWERGVLEEELQNDAVVGWLRNLDRKSWSLEIPYRDGSGAIRPMFPDLLIVRKEAKEFLFDILEPHDGSRADNYPKAVGLAEFAEKHWHLFDRIQLIRKKRGPDGKGRYYRLDVGNHEIRKKVLAVTSNNRLDEIFDQDAAVL